MATTNEPAQVEHSSPVSVLNAQDLERELEWFTRLLDARFTRYFGAEPDSVDVREVVPPDLADSQSAYARFVRYYDLSAAERS